MKQMIKFSGYALILSGLCFVITNGVITPLVNFNAAYDQVLTSDAFMYRMLFASITVATLMFGTVGLYLFHSTEKRLSRFRTLSFFLVFFGCAFVFANEWHQLFVLPDLAQQVPAAMNSFDESSKIGRFVISGIIALVTFSFGWILFLIVLLVTAKMKRLGLILVLLGLLVIPVISGTLSPVWGGISGSVLMGIGFVLMGLELIKGSGAVSND